MAPALAFGPIMPHATMVIDDATVLDSDLTQWERKPPDELVQLIGKVSTKGQPWLRAAMLAITEAFVLQQNITITIHTTPNGWTLAVSHDPPTNEPHGTT